MVQSPLNTLNHAKWTHLRGRVWFHGRITFRMTIFGCKLGSIQAYRDLNEVRSPNVGSMVSRLYPFCFNWLMELNLGILGPIFELKWLHTELQWLHLWGQSMVLGLFSFLYKIIMTKMAILAAHWAQFIFLGLNKIIVQF